jgi:hypothetical protein
MIKWIKLLAHPSRAALFFLAPMFWTSWTGAGEFQLLSTQEPSIADIRAAIGSKDLTCRQLVQMYLDRIEAYDKKGPSLNAIIVVNPSVLADADALDSHFLQSGFVGPLHCVPMIIKDNYDVLGLPTTAGSLSLRDSMPPRDAFQVRKIREAGRSPWPSPTWRNSPRARSRRSDGQARTPPCPRDAQCHGKRKGGRTCLSLMEFSASADW